MHAVSLHEEEITIERSVDSKHDKWLRVRVRSVLSRNEMVMRLTMF